MTSPTTISVQILGRDYQVSCPEEEVEALTESARFLDRKMAEIKNGGKVVGLDRIAVMAALNISHELLSAENRSDRIEGATADRLSQLAHKLDIALAEHKQLDL